MEVFRTHLKNMYNFRFYIIHRCSLLYFFAFSFTYWCVIMGGLYGSIFCSKIHLFCYNFFCLRFFIYFNIFPVPEFPKCISVSIPQDLFFVGFFLLLLFFLLRFFSPVIFLIFHWVK